jgi:hypothetical protein
MPLFSQRDERTGFHYIQGYLISRLNNYKLKAITFIIQPGTKFSSISFTDVRNCEIKFEQLSKGNILQGIPTKIISNCDILFILENQQSIIIEHFNQILVQGTSYTNPQGGSSSLLFSSILGDDFLSRYISNSTFDSMILDK